MTLFSCSGVNLSNMPSGNNSTGLKIPKTPGSRSVGEDITLIGVSSSRDEPARTAARMPRQRTHHEQAMLRNPHAHMVKRIVGAGLASDAFAETGDGTAG